MSNATADVPTGTPGTDTNTTNDTSNTPSTANSTSFTKRGPGSGILPSTVQGKLKAWAEELHDYETGGVKLTEEFDKNKYKKKVEKLTMDNCSNDDDGGVKL
ncbi:hypothetical protein FLONG3_5824 [Fusarium longipes]|uniref:Uncharacterized protein n=1 Tax=Fusarium longipes TaxID=694270 RepID=A0A395SRP7_9HYPO|nr:hypothetical protein FLONG3_5824 [Fusarium longipes]